MNTKRRVHPVFFIIPLSLNAALVCAENIDPDSDGSQYAYAENIGWLNLEPGGDGGSGVEVADSGITGYMWAENSGWISLSCTNTSTCGTVNFGVSNDGLGKLAGYAHGENVGWLSFSCANTASCGTVDFGVVIDPVTGEFGGRAFSENAGWITFGSSGAVPYTILTSWRAPDDDNDAVPNGLDNCTLVSNPGQTDSDSDNYGNACDADFNNDLVVNGLDVGPFVAQFGTAGPDADLNGDGVVNGLDVGPFIDMFGNAPGPSGLLP